MSLWARYFASPVRHRLQSHNRAQSGAEADVRVGIRPLIVAVQVEHPGIGTVVPVTATVGEPLNRHAPAGDGLLYRLSIVHIAAYQFTYLPKHICPDLVFVKR